MLNPRFERFEGEATDAAHESQLTQEAARAARKHVQRYRHEQIAVAAYYIAQSRGFEPGHEAAYWLLAEAQLNELDATYG